ncbi:hypothetical protein [Ralstonia sp. UBA689]|uniref:hypothetical protein n=1 Tax=Ralstonia sp. UBA689 TaxID=1947373 RepID=UPI0025CFF081|nr:hypothetical protein [Ralstonia sp. UBA689]
MSDERTPRESNEKLSRADADLIATVLCSLAERDLLHLVKKTRATLTSELLALRASS